MVNVDTKQTGKAKKEQPEVFCPTWIAEQFELNDVYAMTLTETFTGGETTIPAGSMLFFHRRLNPEPGEVVCCFWGEGKELTVEVFRPNQLLIVIGVLLSYAVNGPRFYEA